MPMRFVLKCAIQGRFSESSLTPYGRLEPMPRRVSTSGASTSRTSLDALSRKPIRFPPCTENQMSPLSSQISVCGSRARSSGIMILSISPVSGSMIPMWFARLPA